MLLAAEKYYRMKETYKHPFVTPLIGVVKPTLATVDSSYVRINIHATYDSIGSTSPCCAPERM